MHKFVSFFAKDNGKGDGDLGLEMRPMLLLLGKEAADPNDNQSSQNEQNILKNEPRL